MLRGIHLTLLAGPVLPFPVPQPVLEALTEVEVTSATGTAGGFQLRFTIQNKSALQQTFLVAATRTPLMRVILVATIRAEFWIAARATSTRCAMRWRWRGRPSGPAR